jgi:hypothetical protein
MKVNKNQCRTCGYNFFTESMFFEHRTGEYNLTNDKGSPIRTPVGQSPRRCLSVEEMSLKGWMLRTLDVTVWVDGNKTTVPMSTWVMPGQLEAREAKDEMSRERMKMIRQKQR